MLIHSDKFLSQRGRLENLPQPIAKAVVDKKIAFLAKRFFYKMPDAKACATKIAIGFVAHIIVDWHANALLLHFVRKYMGCRFADLKTPSVPVLFAQRQLLNTWNKALVHAPFGEEFTFRYILQDVILKKFPQSALKGTRFKKYADFFDWKITTIARITLSAYAFGLLHLGSAKGRYIDSLVPDAFLWGLLFGALYESQGYLASVTAHLTQAAYGISVASWYFNHYRELPVPNMPWWFHRSYRLVMP